MFAVGALDQAGRLDGRPRGVRNAFTNLDKKKMRIKKSRVIRNRWAPVYLCAPVTLAGQKGTAGRSEGGFFLLFLNVVFELANKRADRPNE